MVSLGRVSLVAAIWGPGSKRRRRGRTVVSAAGAALWLSSVLTADHGLFSTQGFMESSMSGDTGQVRRERRSWSSRACSGVPMQNVLEVFHFGMQKSMPCGTPSGQRRISRTGAEILPGVSIVDSIPHWSGGFQKGSCR